LNQKPMLTQWKLIEVSNVPNKRGGAGEPTERQKKKVRKGRKVGGEFGKDCESKKVRPPKPTKRRNNENRGRKTPRKKATENKGEIRLEKN